MAQHPLFAPNCGPTPLLPLWGHPHAISPTQKLSSATTRAAEAGSWPQFLGGEEGGGQKSQKQTVQQEPDPLAAKGSWDSRVRVALGAALEERT